MYKPFDCEKEKSQKKTQNSISLCPETPTLEFRSRRHRRRLKPLSLPSSSLETTGKSVRVGGGEAAGSMRKGEGGIGPFFPIAAVGGFAHMGGGAATGSAPEGEGAPDFVTD